MIINRMAREGLIEKMTREQRQKGEGVGQAYILGKSFPSRRNSQCSVLRQTCVQGAARSPI